MLSLVALASSVLLAATAEAQDVRPTADGAYVVPRGLVEGYIACDASEQSLRSWQARADRALTEADALTDSLRQVIRYQNEALEAGRIVVRTCEGRRAAEQAAREARQREAEHARRVAGRWRFVATASGAAVVALGVARLLGL